MRKNPCCKQAPRSTERETLATPFYLEKKIKRTKGRGELKEMPANNLDDPPVDDFINDWLDFELYSTNQCGQYKFPVRTRNNKYQLITMRCKKQYCPRCGGKNGYLHKVKIAHIEKKLSGIGISFIRYFVFTIPEYLRGRFLSKEMMNKLFGIVQRIIERELGVLIRERKTKKGVERKYHLQKRVLATLELFGDIKAFNPHVNVLIYEPVKSKCSLSLPEDLLKRIKNSYKRALAALLKERIETVDVHYEYIK